MATWGKLIVTKSFKDRYPVIDGYVILTLTIMVDEDDAVQQIDVDYPKELWLKHKIKVKIEQCWNKHVDYVKNAVRSAVTQDGVSNPLMDFTIHRNLLNHLMFIGYIKLKLL